MVFSARFLWRASLLALATFSLSPDPTFSVASASPSPSLEQQSPPRQHTSNWAVLVSTSRFWFNYRHMANVLSLYRTVKRLGIPDSQIILMLPDDMACNPRNIFPGTVYNNADRAIDLYGDNIEVDYRGYEVTVENFLRLLTDRVGGSGARQEDVPRSKRLLTDERSNVLVYMTGHGGAEFLKFQDAEEIGAWDLAHAFGQMWEKKRYNELLFMIDTCQANTMFSRFYSPNIIATGSSALSESSYSHHADPDVGVAVIDRYTYYNLEFLESHVRGDLNSKLTLGNLFDSYDVAKIRSHPGFRWDLFPGGEAAGRERLVVDFFGNVQNVEIGGPDGPAAVAAGWNETAWRDQMAVVRERWESAREAMGLPTDESVLDEAVLGAINEASRGSGGDEKGQRERDRHAQQTPALRPSPPRGSVIDLLEAHYSGSNTSQPGREVPPPPLPPSSFLSSPSEFVSRWISPFRGSADSTRPGRTGDGAFSQPSGVVILLFLVGLYAFTRLGQGLVGVGVGGDGDGDGVFWTPPKTDADIPVGERSGFKEARVGPRARPKTGSETEVKSELDGVSGPGKGE